MQNAELRAYAVQRLRGASKIEVCISLLLTLLSIIL